jgi:hypothetical protein
MFSTRIVRDTWFESLSEQLYSLMMDVGSPLTPTYSETLPESIVARDSSVGIATCYGLEGPGMESRWGRDFPHLSKPAFGPTQPPVK